MERLFAPFFLSFHFPFGFFFYFFYSVLCFPFFLFLSTSLQLAKIMNVIWADAVKMVSLFHIVTRSFHFPLNTTIELTKPENKIRKNGGLSFVLTYTHYVSPLFPRLKILCSSFFYLNVFSTFHFISFHYFIYLRTSPCTSIEY